MQATPLTLSIPTASHADCGAPLDSVLSKGQTQKITVPGFLHPLELIKKAMVMQSGMA